MQGMLDHVGFDSEYSSLLIFLWIYLINYVPRAHWGDPVLCMTSDCLILLPLLPSPPFPDGEEPEKLIHATLKNGHTIPVDYSGIVNLTHLEEETGKRLSLKKSSPPEEPKKYQGEKLRSRMCVCVCGRGERESECE